MAIVDVIHTHISDAPVELSKTIKSIMNSPNITPGDLVAVSMPPPQFISTYLTKRNSWKDSTPLNNHQQLVIYATTI